MDLIPAGHALALWSALHILLLLGLSLLVVRQRRRHGVALGDGGVPELACAIRAPPLCLAQPARIPRAHSKKAAALWRSAVFARLISS